MNLIVFEILSLAACMSHINSYTKSGNLRLSNPIQYSSFEYLVWVQDSGFGKILLSEDSGQTFSFMRHWDKSSNEESSQIAEFKNIVHQPGSNIAAAYNESLYTIFAPGSEPYTKEKNSTDSPYNDLEIKSNGYRQATTFAYHDSKCEISLTDGLANTGSFEETVLTVPGATKCIASDVLEGTYWCIDSEKNLIYLDKVDEVVLRTKVENVIEGNKGLLIALVDDGQLVSIPGFATSSSSSRESSSIPLPPKASSIISLESPHLGYQHESGKPHEKLVAVNYRGFDRNQHFGFWKIDDGGYQVEEMIELLSKTSIWRVMDVLFAYGSDQRLYYSVNNGHSWIRSLVDLDFSRQIYSSERLTVAFRDENHIAITHDGVNWDSVRLPFSREPFEILTADNGSLLLICSEGLFWALIDNSWLPLDLTELQSSSYKDLDVTYFVVGTNLFFVTDTQVHRAEIATALGMSRPCAEVDLQLVSGSQCIQQKRKSIWQRKNRHTCILGAMYGPPVYEGCTEAIVGLDEPYPGVFGNQRIIEQGADF